MEAADPTAPPRSERWWYWACVPLLGFLCAQIAATIFLCDDAFISFRYARNLLDGHGLVFNRGEHVEGYTNFAWTMAIAGCWRLGMRPELAAHVLSLAFTAGALLVTVAIVRETSARPWRGLLTWLALAFLCGSTSFATWSTSGLETRMFTCLVLAGAWQTMRARFGMPTAIAASLWFALAALTRPEGLLVFACAFVWRLVRDRLVGDMRLWTLVALLAPFTIVIGAHFLWRHAYYGAWLPNTYYAKHVRPWYESGVDYFLAAAIELGAWVSVTLAVIGALVHAARRDLALLLPFAIVVPHALYLLRIGGDHFEFRPLDLHVALLAVPAAHGLLLLAQGAAALWRARDAARQHAWTRRIAVVAAVPALLYTHAMGVFSRLAAEDEVRPTIWSKLRVDASAVPSIAFVPGAGDLCAVLNHVRSRLRAGVAESAVIHRAFGREQIAAFRAYESLPDGALPPDAVAAATTVGIMPFYLRELTVIDTLGLTDATVAHTPATRSNDERVLAHDRSPPAGYLRRRGVDILPLGSAATAADALAHAEYALRVDDSVWMPLDSDFRDWLQASFPRDELVARWWTDGSDPARNEILADGELVRGRRLLSTFEDREAGAQWRLDGAFRIAADSEPFRRCLGRSMLSSESTTAASGSACSPGFIAEAGDRLVVFVAGQRGLGLELALFAGETFVRNLLPIALGGLLTPCVDEIGDLAGREVHLELRDAGEGWLAIDHVLLAKSEPSPLAAASCRWSRCLQREPAAQCLTIDPLPSCGGVAVSGDSKITIVNPLPQPIMVRVDLVEGPVDTTLACGSWRTVASGEPCAAIPAGAAAEAALHLTLPQGASVARHRVTARVTAHAVDADGTLGEPLVLDAVVPWVEAPAAK